MGEDLWIRLTISVYSIFDLIGLFDLIDLFDLFGLIDLSIYSV